jgi:hypothetical protein
VHTRAQRFIVEPIPMGATNSQRKRADGAVMPPRGSAIANWLSPDRVLTEADERLRAEGRRDAAES